MLPGITSRPSAQRFFLLAFLVLWLPSEHSAQTLHVYSISHTRQTIGDVGYTLDGSWMQFSRSKLLNPVYFSPGGWYHKSISIHDTFATSGSLRGITQVDRKAVLFFGSFDVINASTKPFTRAEKDSVYAWSLRGGKVILGGHGLKFQGIDISIMDSLYGFEMVSTTSGEEMIADSTAVHPGPFKGYFDNITVVKQSGAAQGFFKKTPPRSVVYARDMAGRPTMLMDCNTLDLIVADVDIYTHLNPDITQGNELFSKSDRLWGNSFVFMDSIPDPPFIELNENKLSVTRQFRSYQWYKDSLPVNGGTSPTIDVTGSGSYFVEVPVYGGCLARSGVHITPTEELPPPEVKPEIKDCELFVPTAFSPNKNGLNETACVYGCLETTDYRIFDRWGRLVFRGISVDACWDGLIDGKKAAAGAYAWTLEGTGKNGEKISRKGHITLVR